MAANIHINLTTEIEGELDKIYASLCSDFNEQLRTMHDALGALCNTTCYKPMLDAANNTIRQLKEEIKKLSVDAFNQWMAGEGSFEAASKISQAGDDAVEIAREIEGRIQDHFADFWQLTCMEELTADTSRPIVTSENFDELKNIYTRSSQGIETIGEATIKTIREKGNDDPTYNVILPAVKAITEPMKIAFEQFGAQIKEAKQESAGFIRTQEQHNKDALVEVTRTSAGAKEIAETLNMFKDV